MESNIVQNNEIIDVVDAVVANCTETIFNEIINHDPWDTIAAMVCNSIENDFIDKSFMTEKLELSEKQKNTLLEILKTKTSNAVSTYKSQLSKKDAENETYKMLKRELKILIDYTLSEIGKEVNRGAIINAVAVAADSKGKANKIELMYAKNSGDITVPTKGIFISTNCIEFMKNSIIIDAIENPIPDSDDLNESPLDENDIENGFSDEDLENAFNEDGGVE